MLIGLSHVIFGTEFHNEFDRAPVVDLEGGGGLWGAPPPLLIKIRMFF